MNKPAFVGKGWTEERTEALRELWASGLSCSQIADVLGGGLSRCAVIGKARRLDLPSRKKVAYRRRTQTPRAPRAHESRPRLTRKRRAALGMPLSSPPAFRPERVVASEVPAELSPPLMIGLMDLTADTCRWPVGDPKTDDLGFCGHQPDDGSPYCKFHRSVAFHKPGKFVPRPQKKRVFA